ncbi:hypothetical protein Dimus_017674 [Dionaea muscipula]
MPIEMPRGLPFSVDTWSSSSKRKRHHFLTHAHKDHCSGIAAHCCFPIYSTLLTKSLLLLYYPQLDESLFVGIEVGESIVLNDPDGSFTVTAFDANHCPGAVMFLFEGKFGNILHTGDCRLTLECLQKLPQKYLGRKGRNPKCRLDYVFLDCTFGEVPLQFPSKHSALRQVINCIWRHPNAPVVYLTCDLLGQEEILVKVSETFGSKIFVDKVENQECHQVLSLVAPEILTQDQSSRFQLLDGFPKLCKRAQQIISEAQAEKRPEPLIVRPSAQWYACQETDLTVAERRKTERSDEAVKDQFGVWHVCYSMHSSRQELEWALELLAPRWVISTTPSCRAMELEYVKKHCFVSQMEPDDALWKLLDISVDRSSNPNSAEECQLRELRSSVEDRHSLPQDVGDSELELLDIANKGRGQLPPPVDKIPVTLFGRARLGFDFFSLSEEKAVVSMTKDLIDLATNEIEQKPAYSSKGDSEVHGENIIDNQKEVHCKKLSEINEEVDRKDSVENNEEDRCMIFEAKSNGLTDAKLGACRTISESRSETSRVYSDSLRKLYRSMNVPVPEPVSSLVELMQAYKRAKTHPSLCFSS